MKKKNIFIITLSLLILLSCVACTPSRSYRYYESSSYESSTYKSSNNRIKIKKNNTRKSVKTKKYNKIKLH